MKAFRSYHLLFAAGALTAYLTAEELGLVHTWTGYAIAALLILRALLGMAWVRGFEVRRLIPKLSPAPQGMGGIRHPFIARSLTLALLVCIAGAAATGIAMDRGGTLLGQSIRAHDEERRHGKGHEEGDVALLVPTSPIISPITTAYAESFEREGREAEEGLLGEVHETFGNLLLPLVSAHILYLLLFRFELARFMLFVPRRK